MHVYDTENAQDACATHNWWLVGKKNTQWDSNSKGTMN